MVNTPILTPIRTPEPQTPPYNYDDENVHGFTPPSNGSSQYSNEYNDNWNRLINNAGENHEAGEISDNDDFIQGRALTMDDLDEEEEEEDEDEMDEVPIPIKKDWAQRDMPPIPDFPKQFIDINGIGTDPMMMETRNVKEYLEEDKVDNIALLYNGKIYLSSRSIIEQQENDALVYECLQGDIKTFENIVGNLPLYNIKKIGVEETAPEYIYMGGMDSLLLDENWQLYSILALPDKILASVISYNEAQKVGTEFSGVSALHCQNGQGGVAGIVVKAYPNSSGGRKKRKKTLKKVKKTMKKRKRVTNKRRKK
jgi:hypothetical protein